MSEEKMNDEVTKNMAGVKNKFMVFSGKGGVGKTTVAVNLAYRIMTKGYKIGILDVDIHGPNVIKIMGLEKQRLSGKDDRIEPIRAFPDMKVISTASILETEDSPVIWRGPLKMKLIRQFLSDVNWGNIDYMIIDSPPGTGDEPLSVVQLIPDLNGGIVVTTPQSMATIDARKSIKFAQQLKIPFIGVIENMSGFICPHCGERIDIFKTGGGEQVAKEMNVEFLGRIPYDNEVMNLSDEGNVYLKNYKNGTPVSEAFSYISDKIIKLSLT